MMLRLIAVSLLVHCSRDEAATLPADAAVESAASTCTPRFAADFRAGLGGFVAEGKVEVTDGLLTATVTPAAGAQASASTSVDLPDAPSRVRFIYTFRSSAWPRDTEARVGCDLAVEGGPTMGLRLRVRAGRQEDEMRVALIAGETAFEVEEPIGARERHVVALVLDATGTTLDVDALWDGVSRGKLRGAPLASGLRKLTARCGVIRVVEAPATTVEASSAVDDVDLVSCR